MRWMSEFVFISISCSTWEFSIHFYCSELIGDLLTSLPLSDQIAGRCVAPVLLQPITLLELRSLLVDTLRTSQHRSQMLPASPCTSRAEPLRCCALWASLRPVRGQREGRGSYEGRSLGARSHMQGADTHPVALAGCTVRGQRFWPGGGAGAWSSLGALGARCKLPAGGTEAPSPLLCFGGQHREGPPTQPLGAGRSDGGFSRHSPSSAAAVTCTSLCPVPCELYLGSG